MNRLTRAAMEVGLDFLIRADADLKKLHRRYGARAMEPAAELRRSGADHPRTAGFAGVGAGGI